MRYFLGIDISKDSFDIALLDKKQKLLAKAKYPMGYDGFIEFEKLLQSYPKDELMLFCGMAIGYIDKEALVNQLVTEREPFEVWAKFVEK